jgi:hypothetical protein
LEDVTEAEKEQAELAAALEKIEALKEKEKLLENTYDSGIDPKEFEDMYSKLPPLTGQWTMYGTVNGKIPDTIINVFQKLKHPLVVKVKRAYDRIFDGVYSKEDLLNLS